MLALNPADDRRSPDARPPEPDAATFFAASASRVR